MASLALFAIVVAAALMDVKAASVFEDAATMKRFNEELVKEGFGDFTSKPGDALSAADQKNLARLVKAQAKSLDPLSVKFVYSVDGIQQFYADPTGLTFNSNSAIKSYQFKGFQNAVVNNKYWLAFKMTSDFQHNKFGQITCDVACVLKSSTDKPGFNADKVKSFCFTPKVGEKEQCTQNGDALPAFMVSIQ